MKNNGAPGNDRIRCYWIKRLTSAHPYLLTELNGIYEDEMLLPDWLATVKQSSYQKTIYHMKPKTMDQ